jgi:excisionase family DNA binding protein
LVAGWDPRSAGDVIRIAAGMSVGWSGRTYVASEDVVLTMNEVCELLRIHRSTVYKLIKAGKIPAFRIGSDWRLSKDLILRWIAEQTNFPQQPGRRPRRRPGRPTKK